MRDERAGLVVAQRLFHLFVVLYEEPTLESSFGESYRVYRRAVPRWGFTVHPFQESTTDR